MYNLKSPSLSDVTVTGGYWAQRDKINREVSIYSVYNRFSDTGRFSAIENGWHEGMDYTPHIYWDSDVAKWIEGAAYIIKKHPDKKLEEICDRTIAAISARQRQDGYFNSYFLSCEPDAIFTRRVDHELYCLGHFIEAGIAYEDATGKTELIDAMIKYTLLVEKVFITEHSAPYYTPGHEEIELALVKLYHYTQDKKYLDMSRYFIEERGKHPEDKSYEWNTAYALQDHMPVRQMETAEGHCVRACYLFSAMADEAREYDDEEMLAVCRTLFDSITKKRMYVTGGIGSTAQSEAFTLDYDLPNKGAYSETCAAISLAFFAHRMALCELDGKYGDIFELALYNAISAGVSIDGKRFYYSDPIEIAPRLHTRNKCMTEPHREFPEFRRAEVFSCSCCPPNINRFISSLAEYIYAYSPDLIAINQFITSKAKIGDTKISIKTDYPSSGVINISADCLAGRRIAVRIPSWCRSFKISAPYTLKNGYAYIEADGDISLTIELDMPVRLVSANENTESCAGKLAVMRGPVVYCMESTDNSSPLAAYELDAENFAPQVHESSEFINTVSVAGYKKQTNPAALYNDISDISYESVRLNLIPYYAIENRGDSEMKIWLPKK